MEALQLDNAKPALVKGTPLIVMSREMCPAKSKETLLTVLLAFQELKRPFIPFFGYGIGHAVYLNDMVKMVFNELQLAKFRVLYIEDDIWIPPQQAHVMAECIRTADEQGYNIVANYRLMDGRNVIHHADGASYSDMEIEKLKPFDHVDLAGMGFYYGVFNAEYRFNEGSKSSVDWTFFEEQQVALNFAPLLCYHVKVGYI